MNGDPSQIETAFFWGRGKNVAHSTPYLARIPHLGPL